MFGLDWGADQNTALARFEGITPAEQTDGHVEWLMFDVAARLIDQNAFLPSHMQSAPDRDVDRVLLTFLNGGLVSARLTFGYGFDQIGQDPDTLSGHAMAAFARAEWADLLAQMAGRYGAPATCLGNPARMGIWHLVGTALYLRPDGAPLSVRFGHDVRGLVGDLTCTAPTASETGI